MPIEKEEFQGGTSNDKLENDIVLFLNERGEKAFTSQEVMGGLEYFRADFTTSEIAKMSAFAIADFTTLLHDLAKKGTIAMKIVKGQMYFLASKDGIKCPKCQLAIAEPRKTWKMTGRPDKAGKRQQLQIGLFQCPIHGSFRAVLSKQKI